MRQLLKSGTLLLILVLSVTVVRAQESLTLTLDECLEFAMANNQYVLNSELETEKQEKVIKETLSIGYPQVNANIDIADNFKVPTSFIPAEFFGGEPGTFTPVNFQPQYNGGASIGLRQMIFNGSYIVGVQAAKVFKNLSVKEYERTKIDIAESVILAFYSVLVNEEGLELVESNYSRLDSLLRETQIMYENGFAEKIDVNRVKVEFNNSSASIKRTKDLVDISYQLLKFQMGLPIESELELIGSLDALAQVASEPVELGYDPANRIEYSILQTQEQLVNFDMKNNKSQYLPKLDFVLNGGATSGTGSWGDLFAVGDNWFTYGNYGFSMSLPIFDGLYKSAKIQQNKISLSQIQNEYSLLRNNISLEVLTSSKNLENAIINFDTQKENMALSQEVFEITKIKYQEGIGSNLEVIEADASFKAAQNSYYNAMYEVLVSKIDLEKAKGTLYQ